MPGNEGWLFVYLGGCCFCVTLALCLSHFTEAPSTKGYAVFLACFALPVSHTIKCLKACKRFFFMTQHTLPEENCPAHLRHRQPPGWM